MIQNKILHDKVRAHLERTEKSRDSENLLAAAGFFESANATRTQGSQGGGGASFVVETNVTNEVEEEEEED